MRTGNPTSRSGNLPGWLAGAAIVLIWCLFLVWAQQLRQDYRSQVERELADRRDVIGETVRGVFRSAEIFLVAARQWIRDNPERDPRTDPGFAQLVESIQAIGNQSMLVRLVDEAGGLHLVPATAGAQAANVADRDYVQAALAGVPGQVHISRPFKGRATGRHAVAVATRLDGGAHGLVVVFVAIEQSVFDGALKAASQSGGHSVSLLRGDGILLARTAANPGELGKDLSGSVVFSEGLARQSDGVLFTEGKLTDSVPKLIAYRALGDYPLIVTVGRATADIDQAIRPLILGVAAGLVLLSLLIAAAARQFTRQRQAMEALRQSERRYHTLFELMDEAVAINEPVFDTAGDVVDYIPVEANPAFDTHAATPAREVLGRPATQVYGFTPDYLRAWWRQHRLAGKAVRQEYLHEPNGRYFSITTTQVEDGRFYTIFSDITTRKQDEIDLRIAATVFESDVGMLVTDAAGVLLRVNRALVAMTGFAPGDLLGQTLGALGTELSDSAAQGVIREAMERAGSWQGEVRIRHRSGEVLPVLLNLSAVRGPQEQVTHHVGTLYDLSASKRAEAQINELAFFDQLTGLANRTLLMDRLRQAQAFCARNHTHGAVLFVDLDHFKVLNDTRSHEVGDRVLRLVAERLRESVREEDSIARVGSDEFVLILPSLGGDPKVAGTMAEAVAEKILRALERPYFLDDAEARCTASIGVTLFLAQEVGADDLLKQADIAMYRAKEGGRNAACFFDPVMEASVRGRAELELELRQAIEQGQFVLHYQPQVLSDGRTVGAEALIRWRHPQRGMVSPLQFIPLAEQTGLIVPMGAWVLETACRQLAAWAADPCLEPLSIAVNVSSRQFQQPGFAAQVLEVIDRTGANPCRLKLELTESLFVQGMDALIEKMYALKARGIGFSLDDFGTGYSSLAYLKQLPLDQLKIDQSFVRDVLSDPNDAAIARTIVALAQSLGLSVIAEGVESEAQREFLAGNGCHAYQGYLFSRPLAVADFEVLVRGWSPRS